MTWWMLVLGTGCTGTSEPDVEPPSTPTEALRRSCESQDAAACAALARHYLDGVEVEQDRSRAAELFSQSCGGGHQAGCLAFAEMHDEGDPMPRDPARASQIYEQACEADELEACTRLAQRHLDARGVPADADRAVELYKKACTGGVGAACRAVSQIYAVGAHVPRDTDQSMSYAKAGCGHDDVMSCLLLAQGQILDDKDRDARSTLDALVRRDADLGGLDPLIVHGLRIAAGEKPEKVGTDLLEAWRVSKLTKEEWSWQALSEHLADEKRKKSRVSRIVIELLDAPRADGTEAALSAALGLPG